MMMCARCRIRLRETDCQGESGIYSPNRTFTLCEPCFEDEDEETLDTNDLPHRLEEYRANLRAGPLNHRIPQRRTPAPIPHQQTSGSEIPNNCPQNTTQEKT